MKIKWSKYLCISCSVAPCTGPLARQLANCCARLLRVSYWHFLFWGGQRLRCGQRDEARLKSFSNWFLPSNLHSRNRVGSTQWQREMERERERDPPSWWMWIISCCACCRRKMLLIVRNYKPIIVCLCSSPPSTRLVFVFVLIFVFTQGKRVGGLCW